MYVLLTWQTFSVKEMKHISRGIIIGTSITSKMVNLFFARILPQLFLPTLFLLMVSQQSFYKRWPGR